MPALTLNGITIPIVRGNAKLGWNITQDEATAYDGTPLRTVRNRKRKWEFSIVVQTQALADAYRNLINGDGHTWSFDSSLYSSKGLGPNAGHTATIVGGGKYGSAARVPAASSITFPTGLGSSWTVTFWRLEVATWVHYIITSGGHKWQNGTRQDGLVTSGFVGVSSGSVTLTGAASHTDFDDLRALPYVLDDAFGASLHAEDSVRTASLLHFLNAAGDMVKSGPVSVIGTAGESEYVPYVGNKNAEQLNFSLTEV